MTFSNIKLMHAWRIALFASAVVMASALIVTQVVLAQEAPEEEVTDEVVTTGALIVTKVVEGGEATVSDFTLLVDGTPVGSGDSNEFEAGPYTVSESGGPEGYESSFDGDCDAGGSVTIEAEGIHTCTITNTYIPPAEELSLDTLIEQSGGQNNNSEEFAKVIAHKIVCESEDDLPNWGGRRRPNR